MSRAELRFTLPRDYRVADLLAFHGRDPESPSERVEGGLLRKALWAGGAPAELRFDFGEGGLRLEGPASARAAARRLLALDQEPGAFEARFAEHPLLGPLIRLRPGLRVPQSATVFEALVWAILGQQINLAFAYVLRRALILRAGAQAPGGLWAHPRPEDLAALDDADLTALRISRAKAACLLAVSRAAAEGRLKLEAFPSREPQAVEAQLLAVKGIGPWTTQYLLMRGCGFPDCAPAGDSALATALERRFGLDARPGPAEVRRLMAAFAPHRSLATFHLWASLKGTPA